MARLRCRLILHDPTLFQTTETCLCKFSPRSSKQALQDCPAEPVITARTLLFPHYPTTPAWEKLSECHIKAKRLLTFMTSTGMLRVRNIITTVKASRDMDYELGVDIQRSYQAQDVNT